MPTTAPPPVSLKALLTELVQFPSLTQETATCEAMLDWIKHQVRDLPLHVTDFAEAGHPSLVLSTRQTKRPKLLLLSHLDVSPAPAESFKLQERDGRYYGRGVFDMKFAAASYLRLLHELGDELPQYDLAVMFTCDEELGGGQHGAGALVADGWRPEVVINPDAIANWQIERAAKGVVRYRLESQGVSGHASRPWQCQNAILQLTRCLDDLAGQFPAEPCGSDAHVHNTFAVGTIQGGQIINQIPDYAQAEIDIRVIPGQDIAELEALVQNTAARHQGLKAVQLVRTDPTQIDTSHQYVGLLQRLIAEAAGQKPVLALSHGGSDSGYFLDEGSLVLMFGPAGGGHHSDGEWIDAEGIGQFYLVLRELTDQIAVSA